MTDPTGPASDWAAEVDEHLAEAHEHIDIAQAATTGRDQATTDRDQATTDRDQATTDRDQATTDRDQATTDRTQATHDRDEHRELDRTSREEVVALAAAVAELAVSVAGLHDLILHSLQKADQASADAAANPSRRRVNGIAGSIVAFALILAGTGAFVVHQGQVSAYTACRERNAAQAQSDAFLAMLNVAVQRSRSGSLLARNLGSLLAPQPVPPVVCHRPAL